MPFRAKLPRGYFRADFGLRHHFVYNHTFDVVTETKNDTILTLVRTSDDVDNPSTTKVNPNANNYDEVDAGPLIHHNSIVDKLSIHTIYTLTELCTETDKIHALMIHEAMIMGCFSDDWDPLDDKTNLEVEDIVRVTFDTTNRDVTPKFSAVNLVNGVQPVSDVTQAEGFAAYNLSVDTLIEAVNFDPDVYFDSKRQYTNGGAVNKVMPRLNSVFLNSKQKSFQKTGGTKFLPERCRYGRRGLFVGMLQHLPIYSNERQVCDSFTAPTAGAHINAKTIVDYYEYNPLFDQQE